MEKILDELRVYKYHEKISSQTSYSINVEALGPTSDDARQHVLLIYHQMQEWRGDNVLDSLNWGWQLTKRGIIPIEMTKQVSPPELLKTVKCVCKTDCTRKSCTCRQYGVVSTNIFSGCMGMSCMICEPLNDTDS